MQNKTSSKKEEKACLTFEDYEGNKHKLDDIQKQIQPVGDRLFIQKISTSSPEQKKLRSSIIVYSSHENTTECKYAIGKVISVGNDLKSKFVPDDIVIVGRWNGIDIIDSDDRRYSVIKSEDVVAKIN